MFNFQLFKLLKLTVEADFTGVIFFFDYVIFFILDLVRQHARTEMSIRGHHILEGIISLLCMEIAAAIVQLVERWISDRKFAGYLDRFNYRYLTGISFLRKHYTLISYWGQGVHHHCKDTTTPASSDIEPGFTNLSVTNPALLTRPP